MHGISDLDLDPFNSQTYAENSQPIPMSSRYSVLYQRPSGSAKGSTSVSALSSAIGFDQVPVKAWERDFKAAMDKTTSVSDAAQASRQTTTNVNTANAGSSRVPAMSVNDVETSVGGAEHEWARVEIEAKEKAK